MKNVIFLAVLFLCSFQVNAAKPQVAKTHSVDSAKGDLILELTGKDFRKTDDINLYSEIVGAYQSDDELGLKSRLQHMLSRFPHSSYADNSIYLSGLMALNHQNYAEAVRAFSLIEKKYPHSNKLVSSQFAKGIAYNKMNLNALAKKVFIQVQTRFPGSPESFRAINELKLMK